MTPEIYDALANRVRDLEKSAEGRCTLELDQVDQMNIVSALKSHAYAMRAKGHDADAGKFVEWYREKYRELRGVTYCNSPQLDYAAAQSLLVAYSSKKTLARIAEVFLQIDEEREPRLKGKTRTIATLRSFATAIEERMQKRGVTA